MHDDDGLWDVAPSMEDVGPFLENVGLWEMMQHISMNDNTLS
jgi:hypothetical protein